MELAWIESDCKRWLYLSCPFSAVVIMCMGAENIRELMLAAHARQLTGGSHMFFNVDLFNASSYGKVHQLRSTLSFLFRRNVYCLSLILLSVYHMTFCQIRTCLEHVLKQRGQTKAWGPRVAHRATRLIRPTEPSSKIC